MLVVMEGYVIPVVGIDSGKRDDRPAQITADIIDNGLGVAKIGFGINVKAVFVFAVDFRFCLFKRRPNAFLEFVEQDSLERFTEVRVIEVFNAAPEAVVGISAFSKKAVDMRVPFKRTAKGMKDANKARNEIFRFVQGEKEFFNNIRNRLKKAVKQVTVLKEKMTEGFVNGKDKVPVSAADELKGHGSRPVVGIFGTACRTKFRVAAERDKFKVTTTRAAIHGTSIGGITAVDDFFNVFHNDRSGF